MRRAAAEQQRRRARGNGVTGVSQHAESNTADHPTTIGVHLSMPDGLRLPVDELIGAHERVLRTEGRGALGI